MFKFKRKKFFDHYRTVFGPLTQELVDALEDLLAAIEADNSWGSSDSELRQIAYFLATAKWETAHTFRPINERGGDDYFNTKYGPTTKIGKKLGNIKAGDGARFHGRGYVQLTGRDNYKRAGDILKADLIGQPDLALVPNLAYKIAIRGMKEGWFTGKKLSSYFKEGTPPDYTNARRIINELDKADTIADIARKMMETLRHSKV
jgi:hypothetical protein